MGEVHHFPDAGFVLEESEVLTAKAVRPPPKVHAAASHGLEKMGAETLVMVADAHDHAAAIYESVGFTPTERQAELTLWPR